MSVTPFTSAMPLQKPDGVTSETSNRFRSSLLDGSRVAGHEFDHASKDRRGCKVTNAPILKDLLQHVLNGVIRKVLEASP